MRQINLERWRDARKPKVAGRAPDYRNPSLGPVDPHVVAASGIGATREERSAMQTIWDEDGERRYNPNLDVFVRTLNVAPPAQQVVEDNQEGAIISRRVRMERF